MDNKIIKTGEMAKILGVSVDTIRNWTKTGLLPDRRLAPMQKHKFFEEDVLNIKKLPDEKQEIYKQ